MKATVVMDNSVPINQRSPFRGEHGFSLLLEHQSEKILFDTGQTAALIHNLGLLGVRPAQIDTLVLSHGHYDHSGGLLHLLQHGRKTYPLYAHSDIFVPRFSVTNDSRHFVGIPYVKEQLTTLGVDWRLGKEPCQIAPGLWFSGQIPRRTDYEVGDTRLVTCCGDGDCPDRIIDDISLYYLSDNGLVVIGGCTHSGLVNTVSYGLELTGAKRLCGWIGGTHLGPVGAEQQAKTLDTLESFQPDFVFAGHCTGFSMMAELSRRFGSRFIPAFVSAAVEF
ncbi:MAG: MBL fold metallo-hydrolase [Negativicutes bacterium]|jgi:7,8-dihydropterin-6-yl-methyl-4-(beta-D-ribofuranosyl)aminobenzene 5'-phosphate synthase|nr:MBL fold metallo-hydrolase [Negativicutes bacterium]